MTGPEIVDAVARLAEFPAMLDRYRDENVKLLRECDEAWECLARERVTVAELRAEVARLRAGLESIREELLEEDCDCPPEWPRCAFCRTRLRIQPLLKGDKS